MRVPMWIAAVAAAALTTSACREELELRYTTYADAVRDSGAQRGSIPAYVPPSATAIAVVFNIDNNDTLLRFAAPPEALASMASRLAPAPGGRVPPPPRYLWPPRGQWRDDLASGAPPGLALYRADLDRPGVHCVAVDARASVAYAWSCTDSGP